MILLALDLSTKSSGYAVYQNNELIAHGYITATDSNLFNRINKMTEEIEKIVTIYKPTTAIIEDVIPDDVRHNQTVYKALVYLQGFIASKLSMSKIAFRFFTASEWRKICGIQTGRGIKRETLKTKDVEFVKKQFGIEVNDDEADAICIGYAALNSK